MRRCTPLLLALFLVRCGGEEEGRDCWTDEECGAGSYCDGAVPSSCGSGGEAGSCHDLRGDGETCGDAWGGGCEAALICHLAYDPPECRPPSPPGGPCRSDGDCDEDLDHVTSADDPVCVGFDPETDSTGACAVPGSVPTGGACRSTRACVAPDDCLDGVCRGPGAEGESCNGSLYPPEDRPPCAEGLFCDDLDRVCRRHLAAGEHCWAADDRCAEGLFCYSQEGVCRGPLAAGQTCVAGDLCAEELFCSSRAVCSAPLAAGEPCWGNDRCVEGYFCYSRESICHAPLPEGEPCRPYQDVCAAGLTCDRDTGICGTEG